MGYIYVLGIDSVHGGGVDSLGIISPRGRTNPGGAL